MKDKNYTEAKVQGGKKIVGSVNVVGDKVATVHLLIASLISPERTTIINPHLCGDVLTVLNWMTSNNIAEISTGNGILEINPLQKPFFDLSEISKIRASVCLITPLALRSGKVILEKIGGCNFAERKIDLHLRLAEAFGIRIEQDKNKFYAVRERVPDRVVFNCATVYGPSVGVTCHSLLASMLFDGEVILYNVAKECAPSLLVDYIRLATNRLVETDGDTIKLPRCGSIIYKSVEINPPSDVTVAFTFISAAIATRGSVFINGLVNLPPSILDTLKDMNVSWEFVQSGMFVSAKKQDKASWFCGM